MGKPKGESRGLDYLKKARPAAVEHLLKFFGESARHLEPKTRFLISVVTKVINFSPRGLEQYVKRALEEGATPDEVIDAVLCAYPCAGLTKVVDAIDVILDMGLTGFEDLARAGRAGGAAPAAPPPPAAQPTAAESAAPVGARASKAVPPPRSSGEDDPPRRWVAVAAPEEIPPGGVLHVVAGPLELALFNVGGAIHAIDHHCPHRRGPLAKGQVTEMIVTCPLHSWKFHLGTGECVNHPGARVRKYPVRLGEAAGAAGKVEVLIPA